MIDKVIKIALDAGNAIMEIYNSADFGIEMKDDNSPLTLADKASHEVIVNGLKEHFPLIPILSEEGRDIPFEERKSWTEFWLVDPLDGTKEFIKKNGEFTVNIALIENGIPTLGVIYAPAYEGGGRNENSKLKTKNDGSPDSQPFMGTIYYGQLAEGAFKQTFGNKSQKISVHNKMSDLVAVKSRSHSSEEEQEILNELGVTNSISVGSSLKFCMVAEGNAQVYYRHGPTNEWDVGAGHAIVSAAGGTVEYLQYNKEVILNSSFIVKADHPEH